ncbi:hypothetical protein OG568_03900 [Streptomyces sp. NBC_01450]|uniref:hypothetical protein n=1 Tax=Streptomyces sp. NBC_01450 TaxID=2903871 RepID=UPI002E36DBA7|nr:hypothetical protein [Streptomyces sp. NBC_01450]
MTGDEDQILGIWLEDPVTGERLPDFRTLSGLEVADGDLLVLCIQHTSRLDYAMGPPRNPAELLRWLQLAENSNAPMLGPRLWGLLLYTDADVELATYVRTHFDDLNVLSGPTTRVFVVERRRNWRVAKRYWRRHLEPELYRVMSTMHWLWWTPYDPQGAYEVASLLGLGPEQLPCLVFFDSRRGPLSDADKVVFPVEHTSTAYFRTLFGGIARTLAPPSHGHPPRDSRSREDRDAFMHPDSEHREFPWPRKGDAYAPAPVALGHLLASPRSADRAAFEAVRSAQEDIRMAARATAPPEPGVTIRDSRVSIATGGSKVSENFNFNGESTTFINRPQDTVIQDFQNAHGTAPASDELTQLLRLVLSSRNLTDANREEAAGEIHELVRLDSSIEADRTSAGSRLERFRVLVAATADIAQPALAVIASLAAVFAG